MREAREMRRVSVRQVPTALPSRFMLANHCQDKPQSPRTAPRGLRRCLARAGPCCVMDRCGKAFAGTVSPLQPARRAATRVRDRCGERCPSFDPWWSLREKTSMQRSIASSVPSLFFFFLSPKLPASERGASDGKGARGDRMPTKARLPLVVARGGPAQHRRRPWPLRSSLSVRLPFTLSWVVGCSSISSYNQQSSSTAASAPRSGSSCPFPSVALVSRLVRRTLNLHSRYVSRLQEGRPGVCWDPHGLR